jgi:hypothetical protein
MGTHLIVSLMALALLPVAEQGAAPKAPSQEIIKTAQSCDARPFQHLVGRTVSDILTMRLPPQTRIYRVDDPPIEAVASGRLSVELSRNTRVRRVYCS